MENNRSNLYHYTNVDSLFKILENLTLKFGTFENVNDPKESKNWPFKFFCLKPESQNTFDCELFDKINSFILKKSKVLCLSTDNSIANSEDNEQLKMGYNYPRMWAQYTDKHTGACLIFDRKELENDFDTFFAGKEKFKGKVDYLNSTYGPKTLEQGYPSDPYGIFYEKLIEEGFKNYLLSHISRFNKHLYFFKHFNWRDENEFRFVVLDDRENIEHFLPIKKSLKAVLVTEDFPKEKLPDLIKYCQNLNLELDRLIWRGWAIHRLPIPLDEDINQANISLDGITYPTHFNYELLYTQACDNSGNMRTLLFDFFNTGNVKLIK